MFEPGQRVVCIDDQFPPGVLDVFNALPVKGTTYTVRDIVPGSGWGGREKDQQPAVYLVELVNLPNRYGIEPGFACRRFAELEEIEDHAEAFAELETADPSKSGLTG